MEPIHSLNPEILDVGPGKADGNAEEVEDFRNRVDEIFTTVDQVRITYANINYNCLW